MDQYKTIVKRLSKVETQVSLNNEKTEAQFNEQAEVDQATSFKAREALLGSRETILQKHTDIWIAQSELASRDRAIADAQADLDKRTQKKQRLEKELLKDEHDLEKAREALKAATAEMNEHEGRLQRDVVDLIDVKDRALHRVEAYNEKIEDLMAKFAEEKESLALSLSDRVSKHKIAKIVSEISLANEDNDISSIKSDVKISFAKEIAALNSTLQRIKAENKDLKTRNRGLLGTINALRERLTESEDNIQTREMRDIIAGATEDTQGAGSAGLIGRIPSLNLVNRGR